LKFSFVYFISGDDEEKSKAKPPAGKFSKKKLFKNFTYKLFCFKVFLGLTLFFNENVNNTTF
jgi:hypothetical protein